MEEEIGSIQHYFSKIGVAVIKIEKGRLKQGENIHIHGATTDFVQVADSMEIDRQHIDEAKAGQEIGIKLKDRVRPGDKVYKVTG